MSPRTTILSSCWTSPEVGSQFAIGNKCLGLVVARTSRHPYCQKALYNKRIRHKSQRGSGPAVSVLKPAAKRLRPTSRSSGRGFAAPLSFDIGHLIMTDEWPYNLPIWRRSHEAVSPDGKETASVLSATEVSMGNPTAGDLVLQSGLRVPMCSPAFVWSDDSRFLAIPQFFARFGIFRRQRLLLLDVHQRVGYRSSEIAYYYQPESFENGVLAVTKEPFKTKVPIEYRIPSDLSRFASLPLDWAHDAQQGARAGAASPRHSA